MEFILAFVFIVILIIELLSSGFHFESRRKKWADVEKISLQKKFKI